MCFPLNVCNQLSAKRYLIPYVLAAIKPLSLPDCSMFRISSLVYVCPRASFDSPCPCPCPCTSACPSFVSLSLFLSGSASESSVFVLSLSRSLPPSLSVCVSLSRGHDNTKILHICRQSKDTIRPHTITPYVSAGLCVCVCLPVAAGLFLCALLCFALSPSIPPLPRGPNTNNPHNDKGGKRKKNTKSRTQNGGRIEGLSAQLPGVHCNSEDVNSSS